MTAPKRRWIPSRPRVLFMSAILLLAFVVTYGMWTIHHVVTEEVPNCYAVWWVAGMVIDHMETHDGEWPRGWDDLRESYVNEAKKASYPRPPAYPWPFDELRRRIEIDWNAEPRNLASADSRPGEPPFRVIWLRDGSQSYWSGAEPNQLILEYLKRMRPKKDGAVPSGPAHDLKTPPS